MSTRTKIYCRIIALAVLVVLLPVLVVGFVTMAALSPALVAYAMIRTVFGFEDDRLLKALKGDEVKTSEIETFPVDDSPSH